MTTRDNPVTFYLTDEEKAKLNQFADTAGKSLSELSRDAVREYTDKDRFERIEDKLDRVLSAMDGGENTHTKQVSSSKQMSVPETTREIAKRIHRNHESPIKTVDVELAIEDIGGASERTVQQYKEQLKKRGLLYEHPADSPVWTDEKSQWVKWADNYLDAVPDETVADLTDAYRMGIDEFDKIAEKVNPQT